MSEPLPHEPAPLAWLTPEEQARLAAFKAYAVNHTRLDEVDQQLTQAILEPAGFAHVVVYGPSGVGKTTRIRRVTARVREVVLHGAAPPTLTAQGLPSQPLLVLEARPPDGQLFNRADYYRAARRQ